MSELDFSATDDESLHLQIDETMETETGRKPGNRKKGRLSFDDFRFRLRVYLDKGRVL